MLTPVLILCSSLLGEEALDRQGPSLGVIVTAHPLQHRGVTAWDSISCSGQFEWKRYKELPVSRSQCCTGKWGDTGETGGRGRLGRQLGASAPV